MSRRWRGGLHLPSPSGAGWEFLFHLPCFIFLPSRVRRSFPVHLGEPAPIVRPLAPNSDTGGKRALPTRTAAVLKPAQKEKSGFSPDESP